MQRSYKRPFVQFVKKARKSLQLAIEDAVEDVCLSPLTGELKSGDLAGIRVHKFKFNRQEYLIAYEPNDDLVAGVCVSLTFHQLGQHENFYDALKRYLKETGN